MDEKSLNINTQNNLLFILKNNWDWIFFLHKYNFKPLFNGIEINEICYPMGITGSNLNNSCKLTIGVKNPCLLWAFNSTKDMIILSINEFFKMKIINDIIFINKI